MCQYLTAELPFLMHRRLIIQKVYILCFSGEVKEILMVSMINLHTVKFSHSSAKKEMMCL